MVKYLISLFVLLSSVATADPWPAEKLQESVNLTYVEGAGVNDFHVDLSGAVWNPVTKRLWICRNGPGSNGSKFWVLSDNGLGSFNIDYRNGNRGEWTGFGDLEDLTFADYNEDTIYLIVEGEERIKEYDVSVYGFASLKNTWDTKPHLPLNGGLGAEGIAFVPDSYLDSSGFKDKDGNLYTSKNGMGGLMFVAHQNGGRIYVFDLNRNDSTFSFVGAYRTGAGESAGLAFDRSDGFLYVLHGGGHNSVEIVSLDSSVVGTERKFNSIKTYTSPGGTLENMEGIAIVPNDDCVGGERRFFLTIDGGGPNSLFMFNKFPCTWERSSTVSANYFVSTNGNNTNSGTIDNPFLTLKKAISVVGPGDTIYIRGGTYYDNASGDWSRLWIQKSGTQELPIKISNFSNEKVIIDKNLVGSSMTFINFRNASYWIIQGLEITNFKTSFDISPQQIDSENPCHDLVFDNLHIHHAGIYGDTSKEGKPFRIRYGSYNLTIKNCDIHHSSGPGIYIADNCHDILIENVKSYDHNDGRGTDGDADGFTVDDTLTGEGFAENKWPYNITFRNCQAWNVSEDGFDIKADGVVLEDCSAWNCEANGFKLWAISNSKESPPIGIKQCFFNLYNCSAKNTGESCIKFINSPNVLVRKSTFIQTRNGNGVGQLPNSGDETVVIPQHKSYNEWTGAILIEDSLILNFGKFTGDDSVVRCLLIDEFNYNLTFNRNTIGSIYYKDHAILVRNNGQFGKYYSNNDILNGLDKHWFSANNKTIKDADLDLNGKVDLNDYAILQQQWGE